MATPLTGDRLVDLLRELARILGAAGELQASECLAALSTEAADADEIVGRQRVVRAVLAMYGGMGSFQDLVLQEERGVLLEQQGLERLKAELFAVAQHELR